MLCIFILSYVQYSYKVTLFVFELCGSVVFHTHHHTVCKFSWPFWLNMPNRQSVTQLSLSHRHTRSTFLHKEQVFHIVSSIVGNSTEAWTAIPKVYRLGGETDSAIR